TMPRIHPYCRWSSHEQDAGDSHHRQLDTITRFAEQHGLQMAEPIVDGATSTRDGNNLKNGKLAEFIANAVAHVIPKGDYLGFEDWDRFSRAEAKFALVQFFNLLTAGIVIAVTKPGTIIRPDDDYWKL